MSYSIREYPDGGRVRSNLTGKVYAWEKDPGSVNKKLAIAELKKDDAAIREANNTRARAELGRDLTTREQLTGWKPVDSRTDRQKIADGEVTHQTRRPADPDRNVYRERAAELQAELPKAFHARDRAQLQRRLEVATAKADEFDRQREATKLHEAHMASAPVQDAIVDAKVWLARLQTNPSVPQAWVVDAQKRLQALQVAGDTESYWRETLAFEAERVKVLGEKAKLLDDQAAALKADAADVRAERRDPDAAPKTPDAPGATPEPTETPDGGQS